MSDYLFVDKHVSKKGTSTSLKEQDGQYLITQFSGVNCENFIIKKDSYQLKFSIFKLNGIYYVNLNGHHIIDYNKFIHISQISLEGDNNVKIYNPCIGTIVICDCEVDVVCKALTIMQKFMKGKISFWKTVFNLLF